MSQIEDQPRKRKHENEDENIVQKAAKTTAEAVTQHYNALEEKGLAERSKSRIFYMRNFNNWIKSMLINDVIRRLRSETDYRTPITVLDMCCGKGGDLLKWQKANIAHLICSDIADLSVEQCRARYDSFRGRRNGGRLFSAEFITCDATATQQSTLFEDPKRRIDLTSCQFAFHYCFESLPQAEQMLHNAADNLRSGGYFIGTIPDANEIMRRFKAAKSDRFGNEIYEIRAAFDLDQPPPLFGAKYDFHLEGVVDCPEFLVHFPTLVRLAERSGLRLQMVQTFEEFYRKSIQYGRDLIQRMQALEPWPNREPSGSAPDDYRHVEGVRDEIGTLSKSEWEAASLYLVFVFQKK